MYNGSIYPRVPLKSDSFHLATEVRSSTLRFSPTRNIPPAKVNIYLQNNEFFKLFFYFFLCTKKKKFYFVRFFIHNYKCPKSEDNDHIMKGIKMKTMCCSARREVGSNTIHLSAQCIKRIFSLYCAKKLYYIC